MFSMIVIGFIGGILTSLSPCIIPVLPLILSVSGGNKYRPYLVIAGLALSFATITLVGSVAINALHLPQDTVRYVGIAMLICVGLGMIIPKLGGWLQAPFDKLPKAHFLLEKVQGAGGFVVGLALGAVYVPCAGPVLAAITVAAATGQIDATIIALTISFAIGAAIPLLVFALGGNRIGQRVDWVHSHNTAFRRTTGAVVIALAVALAFNAPAAIQRAFPDWTGQAQRALGDKIVTTPQITASSGNLESCRLLGADEAHDCGPLPTFEGLGAWINTADPIDPKSSGKVTLVDFWAYACINCQRANEHITKIYDHYKDYGLEVVGIHAPEYAFERELANVQDAVRTQKIHYPVAQDNEFVTWKNFNNRYWPARYLADHTGTLRQIHEGEGQYAETEMVIRQLLQERDPQVQLPAPVEEGVAENPHEPRSPETYLGNERSKYQWNPAKARGVGENEFTIDSQPDVGFYALEGKWLVEQTSITPKSDNAHIQLNYQAKWVQLVVSGKGTITVKRENGKVETFDVTKDGTVDIIRKDKNDSELVTITPSSGLQLYSFTFG